MTVARANDDVSRLGQALAGKFSDTNRDFAMSARPLEEQVAGNLRPMSALLLGAVGLVLVMACACVANLQLVRAAGRSREIFMRIALGASRGRLLWQLLIEGALLAALGGAAGVALAFAGLKLLLAAAPATLVQSRAISLDERALLFTAGVVVGCAAPERVAPGVCACGR